MTQNNIKRIGLFLFGIFFFASTQNAVNTATGFPRCVKDNSGKIAATFAGLTILNSIYLYHKYSEKCKVIKEKPLGYLSFITNLATNGTFRSSIKGTGLLAGLAGLTAVAGISAGMNFKAKKPTKGINPLTGTPTGTPQPTPPAAEGERQKQRIAIAAEKDSAGNQRLLPGETELGGVSLTSNELIEAIRIARSELDNESLATALFQLVPNTKGRAFNPNEPELNYFWMALVAAIEQDNLAVFRAIVPEHIVLTAIKSYGQNLTVQEMVDSHTGSTNITNYVEQVKKYSRVTPSVEEEAPAPQQPKPTTPVLPGLPTRGGFGERVVQAAQQSSVIPVPEQPSPTIVPQPLAPAAQASAPVEGGALAPFKIISSDITAYGANDYVLGGQIPARDFFPRIFGFSEQSYALTQQNLMQKMVIDETTHNVFFNVAPDKTIQAGRFETPSLQELRSRVDVLKNARKLKSGPVTLSAIVGDSRLLPLVPAGQGTIQVASQFNCLEFVSETVIPENGISRYAGDMTQGPACAISCAAGTAFRNYCVNMRTQFGQSKELQINCFADLEDMLFKISGVHYLTISNGYTLQPKNLKELDVLLKKDKFLVEELKNVLRIGIQWDTQVTDAAVKTLVTQTFNSALAISYAQKDGGMRKYNYSEEILAPWEEISKLVLEASYEATLLTAIIHNANRVDRNEAPQPVFLTKIGSGAFGNSEDWVKESIINAIQKIRSLGCALNVKVVEYGGINYEYQAIEQACEPLVTK